MKTTLFLAVWLGWAAAVSAQTATSMFMVALDGSQQVPANNSLATGSGTLILNTDLTLTYHVTFTLQRSTFSQAHLHGPALPGENNFPLISLNLAGPGELSGTTRVLLPDELGWLENSLLYMNIHTSLFPSGEIRGQVVPVPEPSALLLLGLGGSAAWLVVRRTRRR
jgi:hypothetical protein